MLLFDSQTKKKKGIEKQAQISPIKLSRAGQAQMRKRASQQGVQRFVSTPTLARGEDNEKKGATHAGHLRQRRVEAKKTEAPSAGGMTNGSVSVKGRPYETKNDILFLKTRKD